MQRLKFVVILGLMLAGMIPLTGVTAQEERKRATEIIQSTVVALIVNCETDPAPDGDPMGVPRISTCQPRGNGSGTIVTSDGVILTNAHVALEGHPDPSATPRWLLVGLTVDARALPVFTFFARADIYDSSVDLAIIRPMYDLQGNPIDEGELRLPPLEMATDEKNIDLEDHVRLIGYPGVGGSTVTIVQAQVAGFSVDDRVPELGGNAFIKTTQSAGAGVSGGTAVDDTGILIGVPSAGGLTEIRCLDFNKDGINDPATECAGTAGEVGLARPIPEAFDLLLAKAKDKGQIDENGNPIAQPSDPADPAVTPEPDVTPEPEVTPEPAVTPDPGQPTRPTIPSMPSSEGETAIVSGTLVSADTGDAIAGGVVIIFKPGVKVQEAVDRQSPDDIFAVGVSDDRGRFQLDPPLIRDQEYSILIVAEGYRAIGADDLIFAREGDPATVDLGEIKLAAAD